MALITCPDCGRNVSDVAPACPACGRPLKSAVPPCRKCGGALLPGRSRKESGLAMIFFVLGGIGLGFYALILFASPLGALLFGWSLLIGGLLLLAIGAIVKGTSGKLVRRFQCGNCRAWRDVPD